VKSGRRGGQEIKIATAYRTSQDSVQLRSQLSFIELLPPMNRMTPILRYLLLALSFLASPAFAASEYDRQLAELELQRDKAIAEASEPINRRHQGLLEQLLRKATQANDLEAATKIKTALAVSDPNGLASRLRGWWATGSKESRLQFTAGGTFQEHWNGGVQEGRWQATSPTEASVTMKNGMVREYRLSDDGKIVTRQNDGVKWSRDK
jgi:hypothetical protein